MAILHLSSDLERANDGGVWLKQPCEGPDRILISFNLISDFSVEGSHLHI